MIVQKTEERHEVNTNVVEIDQEMQKTDESSYEKFATKKGKRNRSCSKKSVETAPKDPKVELYRDLAKRLLKGRCRS